MDQPLPTDFRKGARTLPLPSSRKVFELRIDEPAKWTYLPRSEN